MVACDGCAADRWLTEAGFHLVVRDGKRWAVRGDLVYEIPPACRVHEPAQAEAV